MQMLPKYMYMEPHSLLTMTTAISEGHGDAAITLLKAGADPKKEDRDGQLPMSLAPDAKVRDFILTSAEREGIDLD